MTDLLIYLILAQRNNDTEGWVNILFIVVMVVFWIVGGIVKSKARKTGSKPEQNKPVKPVRKSRDEDNSFWEQFLGPIREAVNTEIQKQKQIKKAAEHPQRRIHTDQVPAGAKVKSQADKPKYYSDKKQIESEIMAPEISVPFNLKSAYSSDVEKSQQSESEIEDMQTVMQQKPQEILKETKESPGYDISLFGDVGPDELRKAIIYQEILGKPLAERNLFD